MAIRNCRSCGTVFDGTHPDLCADCLEEEEDEFKTVRAYIKDHPKVAIAVVSEATGVSEDSIRDYLRQGRIDVADLSGPVLACRRCGKPVYRGDYCAICQNEVLGGLRSGRRSEPEPEQTKRASFTKEYRDRK